MRLQPAIPLHDYQEDSVSGFGDRERRQQRRDRKRERKALRRERQGDRKMQRIQKKRQRLQRKLGPARSAAPARTAPTLQPAPTAMPPPPRKPGPWLDRAADWVEDFVDEEPPDEEDEEFDESEDATEGIGAAWLSSHRSSWGPSVAMGRKLRIQAALGHRAAVIELKPGLYLVAEMPEALMQTEFGLAPLLAPMMMTAARRSMDEPRERRGPFARLFRRRQTTEPVRYVQVVQAAPPGPALPGPTEDSPVLVAAPNVGWADDATVAATYGCQTCEGRSRR